ncbi:helix-turn-helix domain-containing protein [Arachidicoccus sp.]|jgi:transcriptional regulator with XRE-family HTH domain|uniref:helix-turn-helix domain-containing protein n=1 Tax=Arachidicoccus sp. TaxID=1872624 RepID=UPI003D1CF6CB
MNEAKTIHEGHNVKRIREMLGIKQDALAIQLGLSQQAISQMEQKETLDVPMLEKLSKVLGVTPEAIKTFSEETIAFQIQTMNDNSQAIYQYNFNPIDKLVELYEENKRLYERMLKDKDAVIQKLLEGKK